MCFRPVTGRRLPHSARRTYSSGRGQAQKPGESAPRKDLVQCPMCLCPITVDNPMDAVDGDMCAKCKEFLTTVNRAVKGEMGPVIAVPSNYQLVRLMRAGIGQKHLTGRILVAFGAEGNRVKVWTGSLTHMGEWVDRDAVQALPGSESPTLGICGGLCARELGVPHAADLCTRCERMSVHNPAWLEDKPDGVMTASAMSGFKSAMLGQVEPKGREIGMSEAIDQMGEIMVPPDDADTVTSELDTNSVSVAAERGAAVEAIQKAEGEALPGQVKPVNGCDVPPGTTLSDINFAAFTTHTTVEGGGNPEVIRILSEALDTPGEPNLNGDVFSSPERAQKFAEAGAQMIKARIGESADAHAALVQRDRVRQGDHVALWDDGKFVAAVVVKTIAPGLNTTIPLLQIRPLYDNRLITLSRRSTFWKPSPEIASDLVNIALPSEVEAMNPKTDRWWSHRECDRWQLNFGPQTVISCTGSHGFTPDNAVQQLVFCMNLMGVRLVNGMITAPEPTRAISARPEQTLGRDMWHAIMRELSTLRDRARRYAMPTQSCNLPAVDRLYEAYAAGLCLRSMANFCARAFGVTYDDVMKGLDEFDTHGPT